MARRNWRFAHDSDCLNPPGTEDDVFREAAVQMKEAMAASRSKKLTKLYVAEIEYQRRSHEVWLSKIQIRHRTPEQIAGYIKTKCMQGVQK